MIVVEVEIEFNELSAVSMIYLHSDKTPGALAFLLGTNEITLLGLVTVSDGVEIHGGVKKTPVEVSFGVASGDLVHNECVPGQCVERTS